MIYIKQYGLERSGTNFVKALIEANFKNVRVLSNILGRKHDKIKPLPTFRKDVVSDLPKYRYLGILASWLLLSMKYVIVIKSPYAWMLSYHNYAINVRKHPVRSLDEDLISKYLNLWNEQNSHWLNNLPKRRTIVISYDELIESPFDVLKNIKSKFKLSLKSSDFITAIENKLKRAADTYYEQNISNEIFNIEYYTKKTYMKEFDEKNIKYIEQNIHPNLKQYF